jgi:ectoine hydroxylase-related dioxygenase (phytanoyl-CoA dioxygenase family)
VFDGVRNVNLMLRCYDPNGKAELQTQGHMDYESQPGPILSRGFPAQVVLRETEPFGGNTTVWPGTHKQVQKALIDYPDRTFPDLYSEITLDTEPFEFVAEAGDVLFMHPILIHSGNSNHGTGRKPRISLFNECYRSTWFTEIDPSKPNLSPYERSIAHNGYYKDTRDNASSCRKNRIESIEKLESEGHTIDEKWKHYADWSTILPTQSA